MDPLSGVASIFAVISLALQLGQGVLGIKQFLDTIRDAPVEIIRLKNILLQLHLIFARIKDVLERQKKSHYQNNHICNDIYHALRTCQNTLDTLKGTLEIAGKVNNERNIVSRSWAQLQVACRKDRIEKFERQLERSISILNTNLLLNLMDSNLVIGLEVRSFAQQFQTYRKDLPVTYCPSYSPYVQQRITDTHINAMTSHNPINDSVHKSWPNDNWFDVEHHRTSRKYKKQPFLLRVRVSGSYMVTMKLSRPFFSMGYSVPFNISIQNLIPTNAAILKACEIGDSDQVRLLFKSRKAKPNDMTPDSLTPLGVAIKGGHEEVVQLLLREGADPNLPDGGFQVSPVQLGIYFEKISIVRILIRHGADVDYNSAQGWTLLHYLFDRRKSASNTEYFSILRGCASFDDTKDGEGWTSMHRCAAFGNAEDVHFLRRLGASAYSDRYSTNKGWSPIHVASFMNNVSTLEALANLEARQGLSEEHLSALDSVDIHGWTPLHLAAYTGAVETMMWLLRHGADPLRTTYGTASWFPEGHEGEALQVADLIMISRGPSFDAFFDTLEEVGYDVTIDGNEVYWSPNSP